MELSPIVRIGLVSQGIFEDGGKPRTQRSPMTVPSPPVQDETSGKNTGGLTDVRMEVVIAKGTYNGSEIDRDQDGCG